MRFLGVVLFLLGSAATAYCTWATFQRGRPRDVVFGVLAPIAFVLALIGLITIFVPGFLF